MNPQRSLFDIPDPAPFVPHSATSREAADAIRESAPTLKARVLAYIRECGERGSTDEEIQAALHMEGSTERPRRTSLVDDGVVRDSGKKRLTRSGRSACVWVIA